MDSVSASISGTYQPPVSIYRLLQPGEVLQPKDAYYRPDMDMWIPIELSMANDRLGKAYDPAFWGPVRRFNKTPPTHRIEGE